MFSEVQTCIVLEFPEPIESHFGCFETFFSVNFSANTIFLFSILGIAMINRSWKPRKIILIIRIILFESLLVTSFRFVTGGCNKSFSQKTTKEPDVFYLKLFFFTFSHRNTAALYLSNTDHETVPRTGSATRNWWPLVTQVKTKNCFIEYW